ncbi:MAG: hypothetical protein MRZ79_17155 [Bacteroidia bacterium]|nr:hypothetical protein [Bacteroidia bacterium]
MKYWIIVVFVGLSMSQMAKGQATSPALMKGISLFDEGDYTESVKQIADLLQKRQIKKDEEPKANFFLGQSYLGLIRENKNFRKKNPLAVARAYTHTQTAKVLDRGGRYEAMANSALETLQPYLYNEGVYYFNKGEYKSSDYYFIKAIFVDSKDYEAWLARSYVAMAQEDTLRAVKIWTGLTERFKLQEGDSVPAAIEESYQLLANYLQDHGKADLALNLLDKGREKFPASIALKTSELKVYKDQPLKKEEAIYLFEDILSKFPNDKKSALAYAELLQSMGKEDTAMVLYGQVLKIDSSEIQAHKNLAVYQLNKAVSLYESISDIKNGEKKKLKEKEMNEWLHKSMPHFAYLHKAEPDEELWLKQLAMISKRLDHPDAKTYAEKLQGKLRGNR